MLRYSTLSRDHGLPQSTETRFGLSGAVNVVLFGIGLRMYYGDKYPYNHKKRFVITECAKK